MVKDRVNQEDMFSFNKIPSHRHFHSLSWLTTATALWTLLVTTLIILGVIPNFDGQGSGDRHIRRLSLTNGSNGQAKADDQSSDSKGSSLDPSVHYSFVIANGTRLRMITDDTQLPDMDNQRKESSMKDHSKKLILRWTKFYGRSWGVPEGSRIFDELQCTERRCTISDDKASIRSAHAIIMHMRDITDPSQLPKYRTRGQRWIFYNLESPHHIEVNLTKFNGLFNWTSTYSSESDIPSPYGIYQPFARYTATTNNAINLTGINSIHSKGQFIKHATKTRLGAWFVTNCKAKNNRKEYMEALQKNMMVDIYGFCGNFKCLDREMCLDMLKSKYKFYFAFENSNCREYISEKFWYNALEHDILPVVMGARKEDYLQTAPPHSFIHVEDFPSAKDLAKYLRLLHKDWKLYNEYFRWKKQGSIISQINYLPEKSKFWCGLCEALHDPTKPERIHWDLDKWWSIEEQCWQ